MTNEAIIRRRKEEETKQVIMFFRTFLATMDIITLPNSFFISHDYIKNRNKRVK